MEKIKSFDEFYELRNRILKGNDEGDNPDRHIILVGMATCGIAAGAKAVMDTLNAEISKRNMQNVSLVSTGCLGYCFAEPLVEVRSPGMEPIRYGYVDEIRAAEIINRHIIAGELLDNAIICLNTTDDNGTQHQSCLGEVPK